jgi:hypothetical protein
MPDYPAQPIPAGIPSGPQFPFSRALTSGPLGDLFAGIFGVPGDISQIAYPKNDPRFANLPTAPTYQQIQHGMEQQNAQPPQLTYSSMYAMLPELSMLLRGAPQPGSLDWLTNAASNLNTKYLGSAGDPPDWFKNLTGIKGPRSDIPQSAPYQGQYP